jgi:hypothetical protein
VSSIENTVEKDAESVELVDCGAASEVTKGWYIGAEWEGTPPPFAYILT